ncbi:MAG: hypothetical protein CME05_08365 [Gemmatimonadaceae bacterium]|nr:hypothetical protein [Gemmatimonadaceae bacterium]
MSQLEDTTTHIAGGPGVIEPELVIFPQDAGREQVHIIKGTLLAKADNRICLSIPLPPLRLEPGRLQISHLAP